MCGLFWCVSASDSPSLKHTLDVVLEHLPLSLLRDCPHELLNRCVMIGEGHDAEHQWCASQRVQFCILLERHTQSPQCFPSTLQIVIDLLGGERLHHDGTS